MEELILLYDDSSRQLYVLKAPTLGNVRSALGLGFNVPFFPHIFRNPILEKIKYIISTFKKFT